MPKSNSSTSRVRRVFNLLKPEHAPPTAWDRIYKWLITRARLVIIVSEIIVALAFVAKVGVDLRTKELDEQLQTNFSELSQLATGVEPQLRAIQVDARAYEKVWEKSSKYSDILAELHSYIVNPAANIVITITNDRVSIRGDDSLQTLQLIESRLKTSPNFTQVSLELNTEGESTAGSQGEYAIKANIVEVEARYKLETLSESE